MRILISTLVAVIITVISVFFAKNYFEEKDKCLCNCHSCECCLEYNYICTCECHDCVCCDK